MNVFWVVIGLVAIVVLVVVALRLAGLADDEDEL